MEFKIRIEEKKPPKPKPEQPEMIADHPKTKINETISVQNKEKKIQIEKKIYENRDKLIELFKNGK